MTVEALWFKAFLLSTFVTKSALILTTPKNTGLDCVHAQSRPSLCNPMNCNPPVSSSDSSCLYSPGKNTGVACHSLLQRIFLTQGSNPHLLHLLHCRWFLYHWVTGEAPYIYYLYGCLVAESCSTLCDPMDYSMPGFPVLHHLPKFAQTHVHWIGDTIQPSQPPSSTSPSFSVSQHQGLFQCISSSHQVAKSLELQLQHQSFQWIFRTDSFRIDWSDLLAVQGTLKSLQHHNSKASIIST